MKDTNTTIENPRRYTFPRLTAYERKVLFGTRRQRIEEERRLTRLQTVFRRRALEGRTFQEIADELGISRQRAHQLWSSMLSEIRG